MFKLLDVVVLTVDLPDQGLEAGEVGTIVELFEVPDTAYEVEFVNPDGSTKEMLALKADQIVAHAG